MKIGLHAVYETSFVEAIHSAARLGFDYVQFDLNVPQFYVDGISGHQLAAIEKAARDDHVPVTFHAPGDNVGLFTDYPDIRKGIISHFRKVLDIAFILNSHHVTFHPLWPPSFKTADTQQDLFGKRYFDYFKNVLTENLLALASETSGPYICVENYKLGPIAQSALSDILPSNNRIALSLDIPKLMRDNNDPDPSQFEFYRRNDTHVKEVHLHDINSAGIAHLVPGQGTIDFQPYLNFLRNEDCWTTVEVRPAALAAKALDWLKYNLIDRSKE